MVPRDVLQMAAMGVYYEITDEDGNEWKGWRMVQANAQFMLDQVTNVPGSMLYRAPVGWLGLPIGGFGQTLRVGAAGLPEWSSQPAQAFSGATIVRTSNWSNQDLTTETPIQWQQDALNVGAWPTLAGSGSRIEVPSGITVAQATLVIDLTSVAVTASLFGYIYLKDAAHSTKRIWRIALPPGLGEGRPCIAGTPWPVVPGDYFQSNVRVAGDTSVTLNASTSAFSVQGW